MRPMSSAGAPPPVTALQFAAGAAGAHALDTPEAEHFRRAGWAGQSVSAA